LRIVVLRDAQEAVNLPDRAFRLHLLSWKSCPSDGQKFHRHSYFTGSEKNPLQCALLAKIFALDVQIWNL